MLSSFNGSSFSPSFDVNYEKKEFSFLDMGLESIISLTYYFIYRTFYILVL
jgi:hypothetical protein